MKKIALEAGPVVVGVKTTINLCEAEGASESDVGEIVKCASLDETEEIRNGIVPVFVTVKVSAADVPSLTLPRSADEGTTENCGAEPIPLTGSESGEDDASLVKIIFPFFDPADVG